MRKVNNSSQRLSPEKPLWSAVLYLQCASPASVMHGEALAFGVLQFVPFCKS